MNYMPHFLRTTKVLEWMPDSRSYLHLEMPLPAPISTVVKPLIVVSSKEHVNRTGALRC